MNILKLTVATIACFLLASSAAMAAEWRVTQVKQPVRYTTNSKSWKPIRRGMMLPRTAWVHTGRGGRLKLSRGRETIRFSPNTLATIYKRFGSRMTRIRHRSGTVDVAVRKRSRPHMMVRNRYMTAVVKGTTFRVSMNRRGARVSVRSGLVAVRSSRGDTMDVGRGQFAAVSRSGAMRGNGKVGRAGRGRRVNGNGSRSETAARSTAAQPAAAQPPSISEVTVQGYSGSPADVGTSAPSGEASPE